MKEKNKAERKIQRKSRRNSARQMRRKPAVNDIPSQFFAESENCVELMAAGDGVDLGDGPRKFSMNAYTGGKMNPRGFGLPVVVNLRGMRAAGGSRPIHFAHDQKRPVGHTEKIEIDTSVRISGVLSVDNEDSRMIAESSDNGFPWRASVGITYDKIQFFDSGESFKANGRMYKGPCYYVPKSSLFESSFVTVAGDNKSSAKIAAAATTVTNEDFVMFEQWLEANGFDPEGISETQRKALLAAFNGGNDNPPADPGQGGTVVATGEIQTLVANAVKDAVGDISSTLTAARKEAGQEAARLAGISKICAQYNSPTTKIDGVEVSLEAHAIEEGLTVEQVELKALKASRSSSPAIHTRQSEDIDAQVLEAATRLSLGQDNETLVADYGEQVLDVADRYNGIGLRELAAMSCEIEGVTVPNVWGDGRQTLKAAFTTQTLPSVMENVMNKTLLPIYEAMESVATQICRVGRANDFKQVSKVRLLGSGQWEKVGADGELKHGQISDEKFTNQVETFGQFLMISRQDWRNDDLGALESLATYMAIMGNQVVEDEFFTLLLGNANNFIHASNNNLGSGVGFGHEGLSALKTLFRKQKKGPGTRSKNKRSMNIRPETLLVPVELEDDAASLIGSANLIMENRDTSATSGSKSAPKNPHFGRYNILSAPQLSDTSYTGNSATQYHLFSDPRLLAAFSLLFLDGVSRPTIERVEAAPNTLGMGFRGYIDVGVAQEDPQGVAQDPGA